MTLSLLWISCGEKDTRYQGHLDFVNELKKDPLLMSFILLHMVANEFWRQQRDFSQRLFVDQPIELSMVDPLATAEKKHFMLTYTLYQGKVPCSDITIIHHMVLDGKGIGIEAM